MKQEELYTQLNTTMPKSKVPVRSLREAKAKLDVKLGDKLNAQIQGYGKTKSLVKGSDKLKGAGVKGKLEYTQGRHSISGQGSYKPDRKEGSAGLTYKFKF